MNKKNFTISALLFSLALNAAKAEAPLQTLIEVKNPLNIDRLQEPVAIDVDKILSPHSAGKVRNLQVSVYDGNTLLCSQLDDFDGDGTPDELAFLLDIKANETKAVRLTMYDGAQPPCAENRVHAQLFLREKETGKITPTLLAASSSGNLYNSLQHHGPAWETELIGYRAYFDQKQTIDVYGKYQRRLELSECLWYPSDEQLAQGFGDDVLLVSGTVGVGTFKGWDGAKALHIAPVSNRAAYIAAAGPLRTVVDMSVEGWEYMNDSLNIINRFITYAGQRTVEVRIVGGKPFANDVQFCTGVQKIIGTEEFFSDNAGLVCTWGNGFPVGDTVKYGKQTVGLAVAVPANVYNGDAESRVDHLTLLKPKSGSEFKYHFWAVSEKETWWNVKTAKAFFEYSAKEKHLRLNPLVVEVK